MLGLAGCTDTPSTKLIVAVDGDLDGTQLSQIWARVGPPDVQGPIRLKCNGKMPFSFEVRSVTPGDDTSVRVGLEALDGNNKLLTTTVAEAGFEKGKALRLDMHLTQECEAAKCAERGMACNAIGECVSLRREHLSEFTEREKRTEYCIEVFDDASTPEPPEPPDGGDADAPPPAPECAGNVVALECKDVWRSMCIDGKCSRAPELKLASGPKFEKAVQKPVLQEVLVGLPSETFGAQWRETVNRTYRNETLSVSPLPLAGARFSAVFLKDKRGVSSYRNRNERKFADLLDEYKPYGYLDHSAHLSGKEVLFHALWRKHDAAPTDVHAFRDLTLQDLSDKIDLLKGDGLSPLRIHGYATLEEPRYTAVFTRDAAYADFQPVLDKDFSEYGKAADALIAKGYYATDISAYVRDKLLHYTGIFVKKPGYSAWSSHCMSPADFETKRLEFASQDYLMTDVEYYSAVHDRDLPRLAGTWLRRDDEQLESNPELSSIAAENAKTMLGSLSSRIAGFKGHVGFVIEDLTNGNYLSYRADDVFYAGNAMDLMVATQVLKDVSGTQFELPLTLREEDILTVSDALHTVDSYSPLELLKRMLNSDSINARERLLRHVTPAKLNATVGGIAAVGDTDFVPGAVFNVGTLRGTCESDRVRLAEREACVNELPCKDLEGYLRDGHSGASDSSKECLQALARERSVNSHEEREYQRLHASNTNSITPRDYARLLRFAFNEALTPQSRDLLVALLRREPSDATALRLQEFYAGLSMLEAQDYKVQNAVGIGYDLDSKLGTADGRFAFSVFTENLPSNSETDRAAAKALILEIIVEAQTVLRALR